MGLGQDVEAVEEGGEHLFGIDNGGTMVPKANPVERRKETGMERPWKVLDDDGNIVFHGVAEVDAIKTCGYAMMVTGRKYYVSHQGPPQPALPSVVREVMTPISVEEIKKLRGIVG